METPWPWHRLFGLSLVDFFHGMPVTVEMAEHNAILHLFSSRADLVGYGISHYRQRSTETSALLSRLMARHKTEGISMTGEELRQLAKQDEAEVVREFLDGLPLEVVRVWFPDKIRQMELSLETRLEGLPAEVRLKGLPAEERVKGLPAEERLKGLSVEEILRAIPPESRAALKEKLKG